MTKKHKIYLSRDNPNAKPVKYPWLWFGFLLFGIICAFWANTISSKNDKPTQVEQSGIEVNNK